MVTLVRQICSSFETVSALKKELLQYQVPVPEDLYMNSLCQSRWKRVSACVLYITLVNIAWLTVLYISLTF